MFTNLNAKNMEGKVKTFLSEKGIEKKDIKVHFSGNKEVDELINDIEHYPHAYVLACFMNRQVKAEKAWSIPYHIRKGFGRLLNSDIASSNTRSIC